MDILNNLKRLRKNTKIVQSFDQIMPYSKYANREIFLDLLTQATADQIDEYIRFINTLDYEADLSIGQRQPIKIFINSTGGNLDAALTLVDSIKLSKTPVYTFNTGCAYKESMLVYLAGHKRYAYPNSKFLYSTSMFNITQDITPNDSNFYTNENYVANLANDMKMFFLDKVTLTETQYEKYSKNNWWFSAEDAYKIHICNDILRIHYTTKK